MTYLWLNQHQVDEQHDEIMLDVFVGEAFAAWTLRETHTFAESLVVGFAVCGIKRTDWIATLDTDWHCKYLACSSCDRVSVFVVDGVKFGGLGPTKTLARDCFGFDRACRLAAFHKVKTKFYDFMFVPSQRSHVNVH